MFNKKSDYALNKKEPEALVYKSAAGVHIKLGCEAFCSEEEFQKWKSWSDQDYHLTEKETHRYYNHTCPLAALSEDGQPSPETVLLEREKIQEHKRLHRLLQEGISTCLSETQRRRLRLAFIYKLTVRQIASLEGVSFQAVFNSLTAAKKKLKFFLENRVD